MGSDSVYALNIHYLYPECEDVSYKIGEKWFCVNGNPHGSRIYNVQCYNHFRHCFITSTNNKLSKYLFNLEKKNLNDLSRVDSRFKKTKFMDFQILSSLMVSSKVIWIKIISLAIARLYQYWSNYTSPLASSA